MGSCVSKKAARGDREGKTAAPLQPVKEASALSPVAEEEEEEVKEVVLSEAPAPPRSPPPEPPVKKLSEEAGSGSEMSVGSPVKEKAGVEPEVEVVKMVDALPEKARSRRRTASPSKAESKLEPMPPGEFVRKECGNGRARSPSPRRQQQQQPVPPNSRPRREPATVSAFGCRSGRFSPSAARRAAESAVRRTHSARFGEADAAAKRALLGAANTPSRRDPGERSGRRSDSPTTGNKRPSPARSPVRRAAAARETPERERPRPRAGGDEQRHQAALPGGEQRKLGEGQNPAVAMECFIFL